MPLVTKIIVAVFGGVALVLGGIAIYLFVDAWQFTAGAERTQGVVTELVWQARTGRGARRRSVGTAHPVVRFQTADGAVIEFRSRVGSSPPSYQVGDEVPVLYRPENPRDARIESFVDLYLAGTILGGIAVVFGGVAGGILLVVGLRTRRRRRALELGTPVRAKITAVRPNTRYRVNRRSPWVIEAEYRDEALGKTYTFTSESLWTMPAGLYAPGGEVTVYYLPDDPGTYAFQLEKPPEGA